MRKIMMDGKAAELPENGGGPLTDEALQDANGGMAIPGRVLQRWVCDDCGAFGEWVASAEDLSLGIQLHAVKFEHNRFHHEKKIH